MADGCKPKKRKSDIDLFHVDRLNQVASCKICRKLVKSLRNFTYIRHYVTQHKEIARLIVDKDGDASRQMTNPSTKKFR